MLPPVHAGGAFCGSLVPEGGFCPQAGAFLWTRRKMLPPVHTGGAFCGSLVPEGGFCPRRRCPAWKFSAGSDLLGARR